MPQTRFVLKKALEQNLKPILFINKIDKVIPGFAASDNLIYGLEIKFSNLSIEIDSNFMTYINGLYVAGDGANTSNGLIQASASGLYLGQVLRKKL